MHLVQRIVAFLFFLLLLMGIFALPLFAQEAIDTPTPTPVEYTLVYPGLLPDNPLYVFKAIRDGLVRMFISDQKQKATFDLLQADKRLGAALTLSSEKGFSEDLVVQTISKAENYFSYAVGEARVAHQQGEEINGLLDHLITASLKHQEVISGIMQAVSPKEQKALQYELGRVKDFEKRVIDIRSH